MSKRNRINFFKSFYINDFIKRFKIIKQDILLPNNLALDIDERNIKIFLFSIKNFGSEIF